MTNPNVPFNFSKGLGYSPNSGPPVGGWNYNPVNTFFGEKLNLLLPYGRNHFGNVLSNQTIKNVNMKIFPLSSIGKGNTPGGVGGPILQGGPINAWTYYGYGKKVKKSRRKTRKSRKSKRKSFKRKRSKNVL